MIDLLLITAGASLIFAGLWIVYPALAMIAVGAVSLAIAYGRYRISKSGEIAHDGKRTIAK